MTRLGSLRPNDRLRLGLRLALPISILSVCLVAAFQPSATEAPPTTSAEIARRADGQPDIEGLFNSVGMGWSSLEPGIDPNQGTGSYQDFFSGSLAEAVGRGGQRRQSRCGESGACGGAVGDTIPYNTEAAELRRRHWRIWSSPKTATRDDIDPPSRCLPTGVPRSNYSVGPQQFIQSKDSFAIFHEYDHQSRVIPLDRRPSLDKRIRLWMGDSRGRWEGNTLVVETTNFNGKTWFDMAGSFHSDGLRVTERYSVVDNNTLEYEATIHDPAVFTRDWQIRGGFRRAPQGDEMFEYACREGNRSLENYLDLKR